jgi:hypothetical protein
MINPQNDPDCLVEAIDKAVELMKQIREDITYREGESAIGKRNSLPVLTVIEINQFIRDWENL